MHVLILGGTRDAMNLAGLLLAHPRFRATYSLAGRTRRPLPSGLPTRVGGFGGIDGLVQWLQQHGVDAVVDATHPFAEQMSRHAANACEALGLPLARLDRKPWHPEPDDQWFAVADLSAAAKAVTQISQPGQRVLLTTGASTLSHFEAITERHFVVRCVDPPEPAPCFNSWSLITDRGPFSLAGETALFAQQRISLLVSKNSGGSAAEPKLAAARAAGIPVIMVERPILAPVEPVLYSPNAVVSWLELQGQ